MIYSDISKDFTNENCVRVNLKKILNQIDLKNWLEKQSPRHFESFYSSIDIRDAGFKLAPVDANLYPAGFNNICPDDLEGSAEILKSLLVRHLGQMPNKVAILPEAHTKNAHYIENIIELKQMFVRIGIEIEVGWWSKEHNESFVLTSSSGREVRVYPFVKKDRKLQFTLENGKIFEPDFILLNNDFSSGYPHELDDVVQRIEPSPKLGWHTRKKSDFFKFYNQLAAELASQLNLDPWCIQVQTRLVENVDFDIGVGLDRIAAAVDEVINEIQKQYSSRGIDEKPFVFVKSNSGTYGMGIMKVESGQEILSMNRREKNKMAVVKNQLEVHDVIVQEGIPTRFQIDGVYAEPAIYLLGHDLMGGFLRKNPMRGKGDNLNAKGMVFQKLCISDLRSNVERDLELEMVYGTIAQLSAAAMGMELKKILEVKKQ